jgi:ComF family protein
MAGWLAQLYYRNHWSASLIVPVPLADGRLKTRGYNQASLITNALGTALRIPQSESALKRVRETPSQVGMEQVERRQNVMGAFRASAEQVQGRQILLVDDLYTTGATLMACTEALIEAGAEQVLGLTVGRAWS